MAKLAQNFAKYLIHAKMQAKGLVERPDVIGAVFGQTEGLLGSDLDLRELQRTGRIGRIEVDVKSNKGRAFADIIIPSSLDAAETSLIAASLETIEKVGPCDATIEVSNVEDVRSQKRKYVIDRAKSILAAMMEAGVPDSQTLSESIKESVRTAEITTYKGLSCGPDIMTSDEIIIVEGRADVINLLKNGIRNVVASEGSKVPDALIELTKEKITTAFLDGDRGGELDLKKLMTVAEIEYIAHAEEGKEVEELTKKQIFKALREKVPVDQARAEAKRESMSRNVSERARPPVQDSEVEEQAEEASSSPDKEAFRILLEELTGTRAAYLVDRSMQVMTKVPLSELSNALDEYQRAYGIVFDGKVNQSLVDMAIQRKIAVIVGTGYKERVTKGNITIFTEEDFV
ncbi:MAG: DNA primase [Candidatus Aenigmarchaeota archaeon]|nr:DNA primase [Candidatus Aenigmarchaeota archaeon]